MFAFVLELRGRSAVLFRDQTPQVNAGRLAYEPESDLNGVVMRVLLAEDDLTLQRGLRQTLCDAGHRTTVVADGEHADNLLRSEAFDLVVLDLGLPSLDGIVVLERLRKRRQTTPVLILSARAQTADRVRGLDTGADDYLCKPFDLVEFEARVRAFVRRGHGSSVHIGALEWFWDSRQGRIGPTALDLSKHETTMLESLLQAPGKIVPKSVLAQRIGDEVAAADNMVEVYIHRLRRKLSHSGVEIRTVRGIGYALRDSIVGA
jgi:two-component system, OmpR family, response regulator